MRKIIKKITSGILAASLAFAMPMTGSIGAVRVQAASNTAMAAPLQLNGANWDTEDLWNTGTTLDIDIGDVPQFSDQYTYSYTLYIPKAALAEREAQVIINTWFDFSMEEKYLGSVSAKYNVAVINDNNEVFLGIEDGQEERELKEDEYKNFISMEEAGDFYKVTVKDALTCDTINLEGQDEPAKIDTSQGGFLNMRTKVMGVFNTVSSVVYIDDLSVKDAGSEVFATDYSAASLRDRYYGYVLGEEKEENRVERPQIVALDTKLLKLGKSSAVVKTGKTVKIKASAVLDSKITYKSSNKKVATVTAKGVVKGKKAGKAKITVSANGVSKTFKVTVK